MALGGFGKAIGGAFKGAGKNIKGAMMGGGGVNAGPSGGFMARFKQAAPMALNNAAQAFGSPETKQTARMTSGMMRRPMAQTTPEAPPMEGGGINTGPSQMPGGMMPFMPPGRPFQGGGFMPPGLAERMGGNTGISGGLFNRPRLDPATGQYGPPESPFGGGMGSIFSRIYGNMNMGGGETPNRPQIFY